MATNDWQLAIRIKNKETKRAFLIGMAGVFLIMLALISKVAIEDFLAFGITKNENFESPSLEIYYASLKPFRHWGIKPVEIEALSAVSIEVQKNGDEKFLYAKDINKKLAIASLTKLMTAYVALENYDLDQQIIISKRADSIEGNSVNLRAGETFYVKDLFYSLLMESSNESAQALAETMGEERFVNLMNQKTQELGLENTYFFNPVGLDPDSSLISSNYSTSEDLVILFLHVFQKPLIKEILKTEKYDLYTTNGLLHHQIENNNELLKDEQISWQDKILGGKTGWTPIAGQCLLLVLDNSKNNSIIVNIILNSPDRFQEMKQLIDWIYKAYKW